MDLFGEVLDRYRPDFAAAYGSEVSKQAGYHGKAMVDFIFSVKSPVEWHSANLSRNAKDYSWTARMLGPERIARLQHMPAGFFYNSYVKMGEHTIKYGVISINDLVKDLQEWNFLYAAGRFHKPVKIVKDHPEVQAAIQQNLESAVNVALLTLPQCFTEKEFYVAVAGLSYLGDSRMRFAENPRKVANIVDGNFSGFQDLYHRRLFRHPCVHMDDNMLVQDKLRLHHDHISHIPARLHLSSSNYDERDIKAAIARVVSASSKKQTLKGILSSGPINSVRYVLSKMKKKVWPLPGVGTSLRRT